MLHVHLKTPKYLSLLQRIELQKKLIKILEKKHKENPTEANKHDLDNEIRILKIYSLRLRKPIPSGVG